MTRAGRRRWLGVATMLCAAAASAGAQADSLRGRAESAPLPAACDYARCALGIAPVWNGLAVVRGPAREPVANLNFFWPHAVDAAFAGDSSVRFARRAVRMRRMAAALTDAGAMLLAAGALRGASAGHADGATRGLALGGAVAFAAGVPLQFSADGWLSRAVWWHNVAFGR